MTITLQKESLNYYILSSLSIQDLYGAQILQNVASYINIHQTDLYAALINLESEGMITREYTQQDDLHYNLCSITPLGRDYIKSFIKELDRRLARR
ncbi:MAG: PadR family transcriptional regulator [Clostridia bacterium]|nr:PadR family transcriptional regulator [Clostridia bacterium]